MKTQELAQSLEMMRATLESTTDAILATDHEGRVLAFNQKYAALWQIPAEILATKDHWQIVDICARQLQNPAAFRERIESIYAESPPESFDRLERADGKVIERFSTLQQVGERNAGRVWSFRDVTARKRAEEEILRQHEWLKVTLASIGDAVITTDMHGNVTFLNPVAEAMTGWTTPEALGRPLGTVFNIVNEDSRAPAINPVETVLLEGIVVGLANHTALISRDGTERSIEDSAAPIKDPSGKVSGAVMVFHDVTDRRRAEDAVRRSERQLSDFFENAIVGLNWIAPDGKILRANRAELEMLGYSQDEYVGRSVAEFHADPDAVGRMLTRLFNGETIENVEARLRCKDGSWRDVLMSSNVFWDQGRIIHARTFTRDVTWQKKAEEIRAWLAAVVDSSDDAIVTKTLDGIITTWNNGAERIFGYEPQEVIGKPILILIPEERRDEETEILRRIRSGERIEHFETVRRRKDGVLLYISLTVSPIKNSSGTIIGVSKIARDITRQKQAEAALQDERRILELLNETGTTIASKLDLRTLVQTVTDKGTQLSGASFGAFFYNVVNDQGESFVLFTLSGAPREAFEKFGLPRNTPDFHPTFHGVGPVRSPDITKDPRYGKMAPHFGMPKGHLPVRSYLAVPVVSRSGDVIGGLFFGHPEPDIFTDRSERLIVGVAAQAAIAIDNARLYEGAQKEIIERRKAEEVMFAAKKEAERANRAKDEFLAVVSHELRTPLTSMLGWARMLMSGALTPERASHGIRVIERNVRLQTQLIEDLLDISRVITGKLTLTITDVDVMKVIHSSIDSIKAAADAKRINIEVTAGESIPNIAGDAGRLQQVFWNLLSNAVKFTPIGGQVAVHVALKGPILQATVTDNGKGIDADFLPHVFQRFRQADSTTARMFGGLGLGLAIVRHLVEQHGGDVKVESDGEGKGSRFTVELPVTIAARSLPEELDPSVQTTFDNERLLQGLRILVVEDEEDSRELVLTVLESAGATVIDVSSADKALAELERSVPDAVISDIAMPGKDGYCFIRELRAGDAERGGRVPAIALTAFARDEDRVLALDAGFNMHVPKPIDPAALIEKVGRLLKRTTNAANRPGSGRVL